jgi:hypothetical protein
MSKILDMGFNFGHKCASCGEWTNLPHCPYCLDDFVIPGFHDDDDDDDDDN